jgi:predicted porin
MNKKLLAVAIAGVLAAPLAQAQTANVTLYGRLNLSAAVILSAKQDNGIKQNQYQVQSNSSRLGVRGTEALGGGLNAIFQFEQRFDASNSSNVTSSGDTFAGLQGGWGTMKIGYFLTPYDDIHPVFGSVPTLLSSNLSTAALWSNSGGTNFTTGSFDDRAANSLRYDSPVIAGFTFSGQVFGRDPGGLNGGDVNEARRHAYGMGFGSTYNAGPLSIAAAYEVHNSIRSGANPVVTQFNNPGAKLQDQAISIAGSWNFGLFKLAAVGEWLEYDTPSASGSNLRDSTGVGEVKRNMWGVSATANLGPGQAYAGYFKANNGRGSGGASCVTLANGSVACPRIGAVTLGNDTSAQMWEVSYTYPLSKRTLLYAGYVMIDNKENAAYNFNVNALSGMCNVNTNQQNITGNAGNCGAAGRPQSLLAGMVHFW